MPGILKTARQALRWPVLAAVALLLAAGLAASQLRGDADALDRMVDRVEQLPSDLGTWAGEPQTIRDAVLGIGGIRGYRSLRLEHPTNGQQFDLLVLCGQHGPISVHTPEVCIPSAGIRQVGGTETFTLEYGDGRQATIAYVDFQSTSVGREQVFRVYYSFNAGDGWVVRERPRWDFAGSPYLLKVYLTEALFAPDAPTDRGEAFLRDVLPLIDAGLFPTAPTTN